jgi:ornithine cyclodeaminase/alanine dehydrogenase-like protein (mu-crystallin family)
MVMIDYDPYAKPETSKAPTRSSPTTCPNSSRSREHSYFLGAPEEIAEVGELIAGKRPGRAADDEVITSVNMGVAPEDVTLARCTYDKLSAAGRCLRLDF